MLLNKGDTVDVTIKSLSSEGDGVGTYEGLTVFVPGALPTEQVKITIEECKSNYARAHLNEVLVPSKDRTTPPCPVFGRCGGCQLMHLDYAAQLKAKQERVVSAMERIGNLKGVAVEPCIASPSPLHYRNKIQLPAAMQQGKLALGLYARNSHDIIAVDGCPIHCALGESVFTRVKALLDSSSIVPYNEATDKGELRHLLIKSAVNSNACLVVFITKGNAAQKFKSIAEAILKAIPEVKGVFENINRRRDNVILGNAFTLLAGAPHITETLCDLQFNVSPASFFQVNPRQAENLYNKAIELAELNGKQTVLDAYCGVGTLTTIASKYAKEAIGIECIPDAVADANKNAKTNGRTNCRFILGKTEHKISSVNHADVVFLNPPRKGCDPAVIAAVSTLSPQTIVYISCDPATLARDIALFKHNHYAPTVIQPFDMFPQTMHVETIVQLKRQNSWENLRA